MAGNMRFPVTVTVLVSVTSAIAIVPPFLPLRPMRRYGFPNEILGSGPSFRGPPPGVLIAGHGHGPPGARPLGPVHHGGRPFLMSSTSPPPPSGWPSIQRAKEASHFEYEVVPPPMTLVKPPTVLRPVQRFPIRQMPAPTSMPQHHPRLPHDIIEIIGQDDVPFQLQRTDRPPIIVTGVPQRANPPFATPSEADFQEGYRILSDIFNENAGHDIRSNLIGGSEVSFNGAFHPRSTTSSPTKRNVTLPTNTAELVQIVAAQEKPILISAGTPDSGSKPTPPPPSPRPVYVKPTPTEKPPQMQGSESQYGPPRFHNGPPPAQHISFMFEDPNERPSSPQSSGGVYNLYEDGPPPPFNLGGNSIIPPSTPPPPSTNQLPPNVQSAPQYHNGPPQQNSPNGKVIRNEIPPPPPRPPGNGQHPFVMLPVGAAPPSKGNDNGPVPSADEVQQALGILARYASKQAQGMGMHITPQMILQQEGAYGGPPPPQPGTRYGPPPPPQQQSTPVPTYLPPTTTSTTTVESVSYGAPILVSVPYSSTESNPSTVTSQSQEESSPFPRYGPPRQVTGGWSSSGSSGNAGDLIGAKVQALKTIQSAVTGGFKAVTGLKAGIFNAGLSAIGNLGKAKSDFTNSLKIPIVSSKFKKPIYASHSQPEPSYGPPQVTTQQTSASSGWGAPQPGPITTLVNTVGSVVDGVTGTIAQTGKAAVGIGLSKNEFVKNHFVITGQAFTEAVAKKVENKNQYFQNVMKHIQSIFEAAGQKAGGGGGWSSSPPSGGY